MRTLAFLVLACPLPIQDAWLPADVLAEVRQASLDWEIDSAPIYPVPLLQACFRESVWLPPASDSLRFRVCSGDALHFSLEFSARCREQAALEPWRAAEWEAIATEADQLRRVWQIAAETQCGWVLARRRALARLRDALGEEDYYAGRMPPTVPVWRFQRIP